MSKSLIKNVDGIGIWVRDDTSTDEPFGIREYIGFGIIFLIVGILCCFIFISQQTWILLSPINFVTHVFLCFVMALAVVGCIVAIGSVALNLFMRRVPAYEVFPGSDHGIYIIKTNDEKADQIAICKAAKEIEARCHEISKKRGELDRIAESCK